VYGAKKKHKEQKERKHIVGNENSFLRSQKRIDFFLKHKKFIVMYSRKHFTILKISF